MRPEGITSSLCFPLPNVFGDYIIEAQYDRQTTERIEQFYTDYKTITPANTIELEAIVASPSRIRFTINRDATKAEKLARSLGRQLYVKNITNDE